MKAASDFKDTTGSNRVGAIMPMDEYFSPLRNPDFTRKISQAGLDLGSLKIHCSRFVTFKTNGMVNGIFTIKDSCRTDNGRIVPYSRLKNFPLMIKNVASFLPAAGSSTRFIQPLYDQIQNKGTQKKSDWILPKSRETQELLPLNEMLTLPKALYPCVQEGKTFLELKFLEQKPFQGIDKTICVIPPKNTERFLSEIRDLGVREEDVLLLEQGPEFSTIRLDNSGLPITEEEDGLSVAPAGHGSLLKLFPLIKKKYPNLECLFIRNIDNVIGAKKDNVRITEEFLSAHHFTLNALKKIRSALRVSDLSEAHHECMQLLEKLPPRDLASNECEFLALITNVFEKTLWTLQLGVFQTPLDLCKKVGLIELFDRPLNFLGQVPNLGQDRGGTPVLIQTQDGDIAVCLELPHFSGNDQENLLKPDFATHFNPVFAVVELQDHIENYEHEENSYWIFAEKKWCGKTVYYHESLLYEMIGNSKFANLIFVELPRSIFNPHKTLDDTRGHNLKKWIEQDV